MPRNSLSSVLIDRYLSLCRSRVFRIHGIGRRRTLSIEMFGSEHNKSVKLLSRNSIRISMLGPYFSRDHRSVERWLEQTSDRNRHVTTPLYSFDLIPHSLSILQSGFGQFPRSEHLRPTYRSRCDHQPEVPLHSQVVPVAGIRQEVTNCIYDQWDTPPLDLVSSRTTPSRRFSATC